MATKNNKGITYNYNKDGKIISYRITISNGYDEKGKQKRYRKNFKVPEGLTKKQIETEALKQKATLERQYKYYGYENIVLTFNDFITEYYLDDVKTVDSPNTYKERYRTIKNLLLPVFGNMKMQEITPKDIQNFINARAKMKNQNSKNDECIKPATVNRNIRTLQAIFAHALKLGVISENPASSAHITLLKTTPPKIEIFAKQDLGEIIELLDKENLQFRTMVYVFIFTGIRRAELVALKFSDIDFENHKLNIVRSAYKNTGEKQSIKAPKDYQVRTYPINEPRCELLKQLQKEKAAEKQRLGNLWVDEDWVFTTWNGEMMSIYTPTHKFSDFLEKHNLNHKKLHSLRHSNATLSLYAGANIKTVQSMLGHSNIETTNKYLHLLEDDEIEAAGLLSDMLLPKNDISKKSN